MQALQCLFIVQGEGRGHMTQALALRAMLRRAGHSVPAVLVGSGSKRRLPAFFQEKIDAPITVFDSAQFLVDGKDRSLRWLPSMVHNTLRWGALRKSFAVIDAELSKHQPDVVINFYEPMAGLYYARYRPAPPMVAVAHQYMLLHPRYALPRRFPIQRRAMTFFTRLTAARASCRLALSLFEAPDLPGKRLCVMPPLLRDELFTQPLDALEPFFLIYLFDHSFAEAILRWHAQNPDVSLHCFWNNPDAEDIDVHDETLTFHRLHDERYLAMMARCQGIVTNAGFESMAEAMYLGKPLLMVPTRRHFEQHCNAMDGRNAGAGIVADSFAIERLIRFLPEYRRAASDFRSWIALAEPRFIEAIEKTARPSGHLAKTRDVGVDV
jgi:uncharacterized protein (TIGR00661 family)